MHLNIEANVNEKVPEIAFPFPLTGELRLTSAVEATATIGKQKVKLEAGKTCSAVNVEGITAIVVNPVDTKAQGLVSVTCTDAIIDPKAAKVAVAPPAPPAEPPSKDKLPK